jgi:hypothetical protein
MAALGTKGITLHPRSAPTFSYLTKPTGTRGCTESKGSLYIPRLNEKWFSVSGAGQSECAR